MLASVAVRVRVRTRTWVGSSLVGRLALRRRKSSEAPLSSVSPPACLLCLVESEISTFRGGILKLFEKYMKVRRRTVHTYFFVALTVFQNPIR